MTTNSPRRTNRTGDPNRDRASEHYDLRDLVVQHDVAIGRMLPAPLTFQVTEASPGPPATYIVKLVNTATGGFVTLGTI
jgi:hypothetical protein